MMQTLKGQYDEIKGETDAAMLQRLEFIAYWTLIGRRPLFSHYKMQDPCGA